MADVEREVHHTGGNGGIYAVLIVIVILILGVALYFGGVIGPRGADSGATIDVDVQVPAPGDGGGGTGGGNDGGT